MNGTESLADTNCVSGSSATDTNEPNSESAEDVREWEYRDLDNLGLMLDSPDGGDVEGDARGVAGENNVANISSFSSLRLLGL